MAKKDKERDKEKNKEKEKRKDKEHKKSASRMDFSDEVKRLNRVTGQIEGISKMLAEGRKIDDVLIQCKAIHSALYSIESRIVRVYLEAALSEIEASEKKKTREEKISELEKLYRQAS